MSKEKTPVQLIIDEEISILHNMQVDAPKDDNIFQSKIFMQIKRIKRLESIRDNQEISALKAAHWQGECRAERSFDEWYKDKYGNHE